MGYLLSVMTIPRSFINFMKGNGLLHRQLLLAPPPLRILRLPGEMCIGSPTAQMMVAGYMLLILKTKSRDLSIGATVFLLPQLIRLPLIGMIRPGSEPERE